MLEEMKLQMVARHAAWTWNRNALLIEAMPGLHLRIVTAAPKEHFGGCAWLNSHRFDLHRQFICTLWLKRTRMLMCHLLNNVVADFHQHLTCLEQSRFAPLGWCYVKHQTANGEAFCVHRRIAAPFVKHGIAPQSIIVVTYVPWHVAVEIGWTKSRMAAGRWLSSKLDSTTEMAFFMSASSSAEEISSASLFDIFPNLKLNSQKRITD